MVSRVLRYVVTCYSIRNSFAYNYYSLMETDIGQRTFSERTTLVSFNISRTQFFEDVVVQVPLVI